MLGSICKSGSTRKRLCLLIFQPNTTTTPFTPSSAAAAAVVSHLLRSWVPLQIPFGRPISSESAPGSPLPPAKAPTTSPAKRRAPRIRSNTNDQNANLAVEVLKEQGFSDAHIQSVLTKMPWILTCKLESTLKRKLEYFRGQLGLKVPSIVKIITSDTYILQSSLENTIIPSIGFLKGILGSDRNVIRAIEHAPWLLRPARGSVAANIQVLKNRGVPNLSIYKLLMTQPRTLMPGSQRFNKIMEDIMKAGFNSTSQTFIHAIHVKAALSQGTWDKKVAIFMSHGWSSNEVLSLFRKMPSVLAYSEERIKLRLDFSMIKLKLSPIEVLTYPKVLISSMEKTLIPRHRVLRILMSKALIKQDFCVPAALTRSAKTFMKLYVSKYQDDFPEISDAYEGRMNP